MTKYQAAEAIEKVILPLSKEDRKWALLVVAGHYGLLTVGKG